VCYDLNFPLNRFSRIFSNVRFTCARPAVYPYPPKKDPRERGKRHIRREGTSSSRGSSLAFCREYCCGVQGGSKGVITDYLCSRCRYGIVAESTRAGRSEESPEDPGPNAVCGFATPQRQVSSGPNAKALPEFISTTKFALVQSQSF
jgi:hypothetical protein